MSIRIVADFEAHIYQFTTRFNRDIMLDYTTISAIIFIHCCAFVLYSVLNFINLYFLTNPLFSIVFCDALFSNAHPQLGFKFFFNREFSLVQNNNDALIPVSNMEVSLTNSYLTKLDQMIYRKYPLLISHSRLF